MSEELQKTPKMNENKKHLTDININDFLQMAEQDTRPYRKLMSFYKCASMEIETKFRVLDEQMSLEKEHNPIESIKTRLKSPDSILRKMQRKKIPMNLDALEENIYDVAGVRVICAFPEDIYFLADCLLKQDDIRLIARKDYIANPKPSGYRSLHLIVEVPIFLKNEKRLMKVEVQLRTIAMDFWASLEHKLRYKKDIDSKLLNELSDELVNCSLESAKLDMKMQEIRQKIERAHKSHSTAE
ncbi:MAG: GTP pyrophosphokinase family protein [Acetatifactor sp.]